MTAKEILDYSKWLENKGYIKNGVIIEVAAAIYIDEQTQQKPVNKNALLHSVSNCPFCNTKMKGIQLTHYKCKNCNEYFTD